MVLVRDLYEEYSTSLLLECIAGKKGFENVVKSASVERPGLALCGQDQETIPGQIIILGGDERRYLSSLSKVLRKRRLGNLLCTEVPAVVVVMGEATVSPYKRAADKLKEKKSGDEVCQDLIDLCEKRAIPLFVTEHSVDYTLSKMTAILVDEFAPTERCRATLLEVFGVGIFIQGGATIGKSETAFSMVERGHRLVSDDFVIVKRRGENSLEGMGEGAQHLLEIRGLGIVNITHLYGPMCLIKKAQVDMVVKMEDWNDDTFYERVGLEEHFQTILGVDVPYYTLPVKPGRNVVLILEAFALNHRLKGMGYHAAKEFREYTLKKMKGKKSLSTYIEENASDFPAHFSEPNPEEMVRG